MKAIKILAAVALTWSMHGNAQALSNIANNVILKTYKNLASAAQNMKTKVEVLKSSPTQANLEAAQDAWRQMRAQWEASEGFLFGPVSALGIDPELDTWPLNRADLQAVLNSGDTLSLEYVRNLGANLQGFHTLEYLLFGNGLSSNNQPVANVTPRAIQYMVATSQIMIEHTRRLADAWEFHWNPEDPSSAGYAQVLSTPGRDNPFYPLDGSVREELVQGMLGIIDEVSSGKISGPFGGDINHVDVELEESPYSWNSLADFTDNIRSVLNIYTGEYMGVKQGEGIKESVAAVDPGLADQVEADIRASMQAIQDIAGPEGFTFRAAIKNPAGRVRVQAAIDRLLALYSEINDQVLPIVQ